MNIQVLFNFLFAPFWWIIKIITAYYNQSRFIELEKQKIVIEQKEAQKQRAHEQILKDKDNEIRRFEAEEKTKRLNILLEHQMKLAEEKLNKQNPNSVETLIWIRKNKKGRKTG